MARHKHHHAVAAPALPTHDGTPYTQAGTPVKVLSAGIPLRNAEPGLALRNVEAGTPLILAPAEEERAERIKTENPSFDLQSWFLFLLLLLFLLVLLFRRLRRRGFTVRLPAIRRPRP